MATAANPYRAPAAAVADASEQYQEVRVFAVSGRIGRARYIAYTLGLSLLFGAVIGVVATMLGAVGGILAAIALPAYQDYSKRAQERQLQKK